MAVAAVIIVLVDDVIVAMSTVSRREVSRAWWTREDDDEGDPRNAPLAEHGFSALIRLRIGDERHTLLFDAGARGRVMLHNAGFFDLDWREVEAVAFSHGHFDHTGGAPAALERIGRRVPVIAHEHMFSEYARRDRQGRLKPLSRAQIVSRQELADRGAEIILNREPLSLFDGALAVLGEIPRQTEFEPEPHPDLLRKEKGEWVASPWVWDDRSLAMIVRSKGLVVVSGCAHAGIVNTLLHAQAIMGAERVYAVIGGFHLAGKRFELRIPATVRALAEMEPGLVIPLHCTGWRGTQALVEALPGAAVPGSVLLRARLGDWED